MLDVSNTNLSLLSGENQGREAWNGAELDSFSGGEYVLSIRLTYSSLDMLLNQESTGKHILKPVERQMNRVQRKRRAVPLDKCKYFTSA